MYVVLTICSSLLIKYSTFTVFVSYVKALISVPVSSSIVSISYAGFRKIIDIIIVNNNDNGPNIYYWGRLFLQVKYLIVPRLVLQTAYG